MEWLQSLFSHESIARTVILLGITGGLGIAIGKIKVWNVSLGSAGVLFVGLVLGHFNLGFQHDVLEFIREFGLILFVYTLGLQIGPGFFASLRARGFILNMFAMLIVLLGAGIAALWISTGLVKVPEGVGLLSGAATNTPSLAAAGQALKEVNAGDNAGITQGLAYAIAYPFGVIGIILTMILVRIFFHIDVKKEVAEAESLHAPSLPKPGTRNFAVRNTNLAGQKISSIPGLAGSGVIISRFSRNGVVDIARPGTLLQLGDILHAVGPKDGLDTIRIAIGEEVGEDIATAPSGNVTNQRVIVTKSAVFGKPLSSLYTLRQHNVVVTRVQRQGLEFTPAANFRLQFGDILMIVGSPEQIEQVAADLGNSRKALDLPQPMPFFFGIALGVLVGCIPFFIPGLPAPVKLGLAGGPLIIAILLARLTTTGPLIWHIPHNANHMLREIGITMFLAAVGIKSGEQFVSVLISTNGLRWMLFGAVITIVPIMLVSFIARAWKKLNYVEICGMLAGSMTDPPALAFAHQTTGSDAPGMSYATVYPLTMLMRIFTAQILVFLLYQASTPVF